MNLKFETGFDAFIVPSVYLRTSRVALGSGGQKYLEQVLEAAPAMRTFLWTGIRPPSVSDCHCQSLFALSPSLPLLSSDVRIALFCSFQVNSSIPFLLIPLRASRCLNHRRSLLTPKWPPTVSSFLTDYRFPRWASIFDVRTEREGGCH